MVVVLCILLLQQPLVSTSVQQRGEQEQSETSAGRSVRGSGPTITVTVESGPGSNIGATETAAPSFFASIVSFFSSGITDAVGGLLGAENPSADTDTDTGRGPGGTWGGVAPAPAGVIVNLGGTITSVGTDSFVVSTLVPGQGSRTTTVEVDSSTALSKLVAKDSAVLAAARADQEANGTPLPEPFSRVSIGVSDLAVGMLVTIELADGTLGSDKTVRAKNIGVLPIGL